MVFLPLKNQNSINKMSLSELIMDMCSLVELPSFGHFSILFFFLSPFLYLVPSDLCSCLASSKKFNFFEDRICVFFSVTAPSVYKHTYMQHVEFWINISRITGTVLQLQYSLSVTHNIRPSSLFPIGNAASYQFTKRSHYFHDHQ